MTIRKWVSLGMASVLAAGILTLTTVEGQDKKGDTTKGDDKKAAPLAKEETSDIGGLEAIESTGEIPESLIDKGFTKYVDLQVLSQALTDQDAGLILDVALQLSEGERVLMRSHKSIKAATLFDLSVKFAIASKDKEAYTRLIKVSESLKMNDLTARLKGAEVAMKEARSAGPKFDISALTPEDVTTYQAYQKEITLSKSLGDKEELEALKNGLELSEMDAKVREQLAKDVDDAIKNCGPMKSPEEAEAIKALAGAGRDSNKGDVQARVRSGGWIVAWGKEVGLTEYAKMISAMATGTLGVYLADMLRESARTLGWNVVLQAVKNRGSTFGAGQFLCQAGIATYNNWRYVTIFGRKYKISNPNSHQPYVRWKRR